MKKNPTQLAPHAYYNRMEQVNSHTVQVEFGRVWVWDAATNTYTNRPALRHEHTDHDTSYTSIAANSHTHLAGGTALDDDARGAVFICVVCSSSLVAVDPKARTTKRRGRPPRHASTATGANRASRNTAISTPSSDGGVLSAESGSDAQRS